MGKLTINLCEELHQKIREDVAADESLTTGLLMERIIREHYEGPKPRPRIESGGRTMAFSVSEELFQRVKRYLAAHGGQSQRDFVIGLVTQGLALWEQGKALKMLEGYTPQRGTGRWRSPSRRSCSIRSKHTWPRIRSSPKRNLWSVWWKTPSQPGRPGRKRTDRP